MTLTGRISTDVKFIDKQRSVIDKEHSDEKRGFFKFKSKKYFDKQGTEGRMPDFVLKWQENDPEEISKWEAQFGAECVTANDSVYPEPLRTNGEGHYQVGDVVLMKIPIDNWLAHRERAVTRSKRAVKSKLRDFQRRAKNADGEDASMKITGTVGGEPI